MSIVLPVLPILPLDAARTVPAEQQSPWFVQFMQVLRQTLGLSRGSKYDADVANALLKVQKNAGLPDAQEGMISQVIGVPVAACATYKALGIEGATVTYVTPLLTYDEQANIALAEQYGLVKLRCRRSWLDYAWEYTPYISLVFMGITLVRTVFGWLDVGIEGGVS